MKAVAMRMSFVGTLIRIFGIRLSTRGGVLMFG